MQIQLSIPCYIDQFYPKVAIATYELLQKLGCEITYPLNQTCCGQPITTYNSHFTRPAKEKELHVVLVNNNRTQQLAKVDYRNSLKCIRCAACFNTCPIYQKSGRYGYIIPLICFIIIAFFAEFIRKSKVQSVN